MKNHTCIQVEHTNKLITNQMCENQENNISQCQTCDSISDQDLKINENRVKSEKINVFF